MKPWAGSAPVMRATSVPSTAASRVSRPSSTSSARRASALDVANYLPVIVIDKCPQAPIGEITILCPDGAELQPGWLDALLNQEKQGVVDLRH